MNLTLLEKHLDSYQIKVDSAWIKMLLGGVLVVRKPAWSGQALHAAALNNLELTVLQKTRRKSRILSSLNDIWELLET